MASNKKRGRTELVTMNKKLESSWMLSSDGKLRSDEEKEMSDKAIKKFCKNKNLASIFTERHPNLLSVVMVLMQEYNLELAVATPFLDPDEKYVKTGVYEYAKCEMKLVSPIMICAVGSIEKVLVAALQILFFNGKKDGQGTDYAVSVLELNGTCDVTISFKFNGYDANVKLAQYDETRVISMYIED